MSTDRTWPILADFDGSDDPCRDLLTANACFIHRYQGWTVIGKGLFSTVVKTHQRDLGKDIAVKVFVSADEDLVERIQREVRHGQRVVSPYAVQTYSFFRSGALAWYEMELVEGTNLQKALDLRQELDTPFAVVDAVNIASAIAMALRQAHDEGVVHRDVKPTNILLPVSRRPVAKIGDFGISRLLDSPKFTSSGAFAGTPRYGSPEAFTGPCVGPAHDIHCLTACLYLMLSGNRFPYDIPQDASIAAIGLIFQNDRPRPIEDFVPGIDKELSALIAQGLAKRPKLRPAAADLVSALEAIRTRLAPASLDQGERQVTGT